MNKKNQFAAYFLLVASSLLLCSCTTSRPHLPIVDRKVDLERFMGDWYVIAGKFTFLEKNAFNGIESYELKPDGKIATTYTFRKGGFDGPLKRYNPTGFIHNPENNAEWRMQFLWPFKTPYLILYLDEEYRYTAIGEPDRKYLWIMAREPDVPDSVMNAITSRLTEVGYDTSSLQTMPQQWPETSPR